TVDTDWINGARPDGVGRDGTGREEAAVRPGHLSFALEMLGIDRRSAQFLKRSLRPWSMKAVSAGLAPPPAKWPQTPGMTRSSALGIRSTSHALSSGGK